jgi:hypothetical protein
MRRNPCDFLDPEYGSMVVGTRNPLRASLSLSIRRGTALAAVTVAASCAGKSSQQGGEGDGSEGGTSGTATVHGGSSGASSSTGGQSGSAGVATSGTSGTSSGGSTSALPPYSLNDVGCSGPVYDGGYDGQCCVKASCYTPDAGTCLHADASPPIARPAGSGTCGCAVEGRVSMLMGPFSRNPDDTTVTTGTCCYLEGWIGCEGRPLLVAGVAVVAPLVTREDWCRALG